MPLSGVLLKFERENIEPLNIIKGKKYRYRSVLEKALVSTKWHIQNQMGMHVDLPKCNLLN